jgi:hypothetical protein
MKHGKRSSEGVFSTSNIPFTFKISVDVLVVGCPSAGIPSCKYFQCGQEPGDLAQQLPAAL